MLHEREFITLDCAIFWKEILWGDQIEYPFWKMHHGLEFHRYILFNTERRLKGMWIWSGLCSTWLWNLIILSVSLPFRTSCFGGTHSLRRTGSRGEFILVAAVESIKFRQQQEKPISLCAVQQRWCLMINEIGRKKRNWEEEKVRGRRRARNLVVPQDFRKIYALSQSSIFQLLTVRWPEKLSSNFKKLTVEYNFPMNYDWKIMPRLADN